jgi:signal transduction histidine kinase
MGQMLISFLPQEDADESPFLTRSIYDFFRDSQNAANLEIYKGKIVLIGLGQDVRGGNEYQRPNGQRINDILIQANILNTILSRNFICKWNQKQNMLCIILFSLILALLIILTDHKWKGNLARILLFSNLAIIVYLMLVAIMFFAYGYWINSVYPVLAMELSTISCTMFLGHEELKDRYYKLKIANEDLNKANIQVKEEEQKLLDAYDIIGKTYSEITGNNVPHNAEDIGASLHDIADHLYNSHHELLNFIDRASHDLRSPLVHIQNRLEISGGRLDESFPQVKKYIDQTSKLIEEILDISRIRAGKFEVNRIEDTQIKSAILSSAEFARSEAEKYGINLEYEIDKLPPLYADKQAIIRIINNILDNAIKFTPKGGNIRLIATDDEKSIRIQVHDSGTGIPSDILNRIFEPYFTTKPLNPISKGMGLGLAIVQKIVQLHDGAIKVESETGKGTAFTIMLPKQKDD